MFRFSLNHHQRAYSLCIAKLLYWYQLIYFVIKIVLSCGHMLMPWLYSEVLNWLLNGNKLMGIKNCCYFPFAF